MAAIKDRIARQAASGSAWKRNSIHLLLVLGLICGLSTEVWAQCLPTSWVISGRVVDTNGVGIEGIDIDIVDPFTGLSLVLSQDVTLVDGNFTTIICEVAAPGFYDVLFQTAPAMPYFDLLVQTVNLVGNTDLGVLALDDASIVSGRVNGETGQALAEVDLDFFDPISGQETVFSGDFTDGDGLFSVKVIADFWDIRLTEGPGTSPTPLVPILVKDVPLISSLDLGDLLMRDGHNLTGTIQDASGGAVDGADIDVIDPITDEKIVTPGDNTNGSGIFQVLVPSGSWELEVDPPQGTGLVSSLSTIVVPVGGVDIGVITLPSGFSVSGSVVDSGGDVVADTDLDFFISATGIEIPTAHDNANSSGVFSVQVEPETYDIAFRPRFVSGAAPLVINSIVVAADTNLGQIALPDGFALTGTVVAGTDPVGEVEITLTDSSTGADVYVFGNDTDGLGAYALRQIAGTYDVTATPLPGSGFPTQVVPDVVLDSDRNLVIDLLGGTAPIPPNPIENFECVSSSGSIQLSWIPGNTDYDLIQIERNGAFLANLPGSSTSFLDQFAPQNLLQYTAIAIREALTSAPVDCLVDNSPAPPTAPLPVFGLTCIEEPTGVSLQWQLGEPDYDAVEVHFDGVLLETLSGQAVSYLHAAVSTGLHQWSLIAIRSGLETAAVNCSVDVAGGGPGPSFLRGDANTDSNVNVADAVFVLTYLFIQGPSGPCLDSLDANDSGTVNIADGIRLLNFLFVGGDPPEQPWPVPGEDPTPDSLPCS
ncbi:MAG: hypothetical protein VX764_09715 [Planctomycetota bacterium]|nr:hypothetical protein [Planctomycetota bacterium]